MLYNTEFLLNIRYHDRCIQVQRNSTLTVLAADGLAELGAMEGELVPFMITVGFVTDGSEGKGVAMGGLKKSSAFVGIEVVGVGVSG